MTRRDAVYPRDVAALESRLQQLLAAWGGADEAQIADYEARREWVLDRIGDQIRDQRRYDERLRDPRAEHRRHDLAAYGRHAHLAAIPGLERDDAEAPNGAPYRREAGTAYAAVDQRLDEIDDALRTDTDAERYRWHADEAGDRERVLTEGPATFIGGMWFTPDDDAPGGVRPLTEAELRRITDQVRATQADALAQDLDRPPDHRPAESQDVADGQEWDR